MIFYFILSDINKINLSFKYNDLYYMFVFSILEDECCNHFYTTIHYTIIESTGYPIL